MSVSVNSPKFQKDFDVFWEGGAAEPRVPYN